MFHSSHIYLQMVHVHIGETLYLRRVKGSSDGDNVGVKFLSSKVTSKWINYWCLLLSSSFRPPRIKIFYCFQFLPHIDLPALLQVASAETLSTARLGADISSVAYGITQPMPLSDKVISWRYFIFKPYNNTSLVNLVNKALYESELKILFLWFKPRSFYW